MDQKELAGLGGKRNSVQEVQLGEIGWQDRLLSRWRAGLGKGASQGVGDRLVLPLLSDHAHLPAHRCTHPAQVMTTAGIPPPTHLPRLPAAPTQPPSTWQVCGGSPKVAGRGPRSLCLSISLSPSSLQKAAYTPRPSSGAPQARRASGPCWVGARPPCPSHLVAAAPWAVVVAVGLAAYTSTSAW